MVVVVVSGICSLLNSPRDVDSAEPTLKQDFFPFLLFFLDRPTAGWNCSSCGVGVGRGVGRENDA